MHIQDLPIEVFKLLLQHVAVALGVRLALRLRLVSKLFANEMIEATVESGALDEVTGDYLALHMGFHGKELLVHRCPNEELKARYLYLRAQREPVESTEFIDRLRHIATEYVSVSGGRCDYNTSLEALCGVVAQFYHLSRGLSGDMVWPNSREEYRADQACLSIACSLGNLDLVSKLLDKEGVRINTADSVHFLSYPIRAAVRSGHEEVVEYLLERNSRTEADEYDALEWTIIYDATRNHKPNMLKFLLDKHLAFPARECHAGTRLGSAYENALMTAANHNNDVAFKLLLQAGPIKAPLPLPLQRLVLMAACEGRSVYIARSIFDMNPSLDPNYDLREVVSSRTLIPFSEQRQCPLQAAAHWGSIELVELLLQHGADPNWTNQNGGPALYRAARHGYRRCAEMLLRAGANPDDIADLEDD